MVDELSEVLTSSITELTTLLPSGIDIDTAFSFVNGRFKNAEIACVPDSLFEWACTDSRFWGKVVALGYLLHIADDKIGNNLISRSFDSGNCPLANQAHEKEIWSYFFTKLFDFVERDRYESINCGLFMLFSDKECTDREENLENNLDLYLYFLDYCVSRRPLSSSVKKFESVVKVLYATPQKYQEEVIKRLLAPILEAIMKSEKTVPGEIIQGILDLRQDLYMNNEYIFSTIIGILLTVDGGSFDTLVHDVDFWKFASKCLLSIEPIVRKRGAYFLQFLPRSEKSNSKKNKSEACSFSWWEKYLDIYQQIEGCTYSHLITQIWSHMLCLFESLVDDRTVSDFHLENGYPSFNFQWAKALLHCMLRSQIPTIRKSIVLRILSGRIPLCFDSFEVLSWLSNELPVLVDSPIFFPTKFVWNDELFGIKQLKDSHASHNVSLSNIFPDSMLNTDADEIFSPVHAPGILFPSFYGFLFLILEDDKRQWFIRSLIECLTRNISSLSANKWLFRIFSENIISKHISDSLDLESLALLRSYHDRVIVCANGIVRDQLLLGYFSIVAKGFNSSTTSIVSCLNVVINCWKPRYLFDIRMIDNITALFSKCQKYLLTAKESCCNISNWNDSFRILGFFFGMIFSKNHLEANHEMFGSFSCFVRTEISPLFHAYSRPYSLTDDQLINILLFFDGVNQFFPRGAAPSSVLLESLVELVSKDNLIEILQFTNLQVYQALVDPMSRSQLCLDHVNSMISLLESLGYLCDSVGVWEFYLQSVGNTIINGMDSFLSSTNFLDGKHLIISSATFGSLTTSIFFLFQILSFFAKMIAWKNCIMDRQFYDKIALFGTTLLNITDISASNVQIGDNRDYPIRIYQILNIVSSNAEFLAGSDHISSNLLSNRFVALWMSSRWSMLSSIAVLLSGKNRLLEHSVSFMNFLSNACEHLSICDEESIVCILSAVDLALKEFVLSFQRVEENDAIEDLLDQLFDNGWEAVLGMSHSPSSAAFQALLDVIFGNASLTMVSPSIILRYVDRIMDTCSKTRPQWVQRMTARFCLSWSSQIELSVPYFPLISKLVLYREPKVDDHCAIDPCSTELCSSLGGGDLVCRVSLLVFLELFQSSCLKSVEYQRCLDDFAVLLLRRNLEKALACQAMIGSELFGEKLRIWQALCVVAPGISSSFIDEIVDIYYVVLSQSCSHSIRVHMEIFGAMMFTKFPDVFYPRLAEKLTVFEHNQQTLASFFIIIGYFIAARNDLSTVVVPGYANFIEDTIHLMHPWLGYSGGLPRSIAQYVLSKLIPVHIDGINTNSKDVSLLRGLMSIFSMNRECERMILRQEQFFRDFGLVEHCTVRGLLSLGSDNTGEIVSKHLLTILSDSFKEYVEEEKSKLLSPEDSNETNNDSIITLQTKRIPLDSLCLLWKNNRTETVEMNAAMKMRHPIVVCASLVDKATNLAGIARTCEIFAVEKLILPSMQVTRNEEFKAIAVSATSWLVLEEQSPKDLRCYLMSMKRQGYCVVGLEQTDSSRPLQSTDFPGKIVLLLGKEKEGIPVELLQLVDICIEIPQFGVIRSLNVHVSAAIAIWEFTKQHISK